LSCEHNSGVDPYTCRGGETWCASLLQCISISTPCPGGGSGGDVDLYGCRPSAGYEWCAARHECIRPFETHCGGHSVACPYHYDPVWCGRGGNKYLNLCQAEVEGYYEADCTRYPGDDYYNNVCPLPIEEGDCYGSHTSIPAWGYDSYTGYCEAFEWCGSGGNGNRFESRQRCEENCGDIGNGDHHGPGHGPVSCGTVYDPVWCSDGNGEYEYSNLCEAVNEGFYEDQCMSYPAGQHQNDPVVACGAVHDPVWCNDGNGEYEYSNLCEAVNEGFYEDQCMSYPAGQHQNDPVIACPIHHNPVWCGEHYQNEYTNLCRAEADGYYQSDCTDRDPNGGGGGHDEIVCPAVYDPVCCDGYDYSNLCQAEVDGYYHTNCTNGVCGGGGGGHNNWDNNACPDFCYAPRLTGNCRQNIPKWGYDAQNGRCKEFTYGGCGGTWNKFDTEDDCAHQCQQC